MPNIGELLGGGLGNDPVSETFLYNMIGALIQAVFAPELTGVEQAAWGATEIMRLSPAEAAAAVVRGFLTEGAAADDASKSGVNRERFGTLVRLAGAAPGPGELAEAMRRGVIPADSGNPDVPGFLQGIREGNLSDKWAGMVEALSVQWPTPNDALQALLEGQIDDATAHDLYHKFGGDPQYFQMLYDTRGNAPSPNEAAEMARRGIIPWDGIGPDSVSYAQAFLEGPWRNKWTEPFKTLSEYHPPPRTIVAMIRDGSIDDETATRLLSQAGVPPELAASYLHEGHTQKTTPHKDLAVGTVTTLYRDQLVNHDTAAELLKALNYDDQEISYILAIEDMRVAQAQMTASVGRIRTLYEHRKISKTTAGNNLRSIGLQQQQVDTLLTTWAYTRQGNVQHLTAAQIGAAFKNQIIEQGDATEYLVGQGYSPYEAWLLLSIDVKEALPNKPEVSYVGSTPDT